MGWFYGSLAPHVRAARGRSLQGPQRMSQICGALPAGCTRQARRLQLLLISGLERLTRYFCQLHRIRFMPRLVLLLILLLFAEASLGRS